jgi:DNA-binding transcriptional MocR family regulator
MRRVEARIGRPLEEFLAERYRQRTQEQLADELGVDRSTVNRWMRDLDIEARFPGQRPPEAVA